MNKPIESSGNSIPTAFAYLEAESERAWLDQVFVPPPDFSAMQTSQSVIVFGARGAGKTAVRVKLEQLAERGMQDGKRLVAHWPVSLVREDLAGSGLVNHWLGHVHAACARALLVYIAHNPAAFTAAPNWVRDTACWYLQCYVHTPWQRLVDRIAENCSADDDALLRSLFLQPAPPILEGDDAPERVLTELSAMLKRLELSGVWLLVDNLEPWVAVEPARVSASLRTLFATLALFQAPEFSFKIMAPVELEPAIADSSGIVRHRIMRIPLNWTEEALRSIIVRRLALLTGHPSFKLANLGDEATLDDWLRRFGGATPRGWLNCLRPLTDAYITQERKRPFSARECHSILRNQPPQLHVDRTSVTVFVGNREIRNLPIAAYQLLLYLYEQRPRVCLRSELYFRGYLGLDHEPRLPGDPHWESQADYDDVLNTAIYRLRRALEPDPKKPIYIVTQRNRGISLQNAW